MKTTRGDFTIRAAMIRSAGFTLIELLAVISILTLLISILLPALSSARQTAKAGVCLSQLKSIGNAAAIYLDENEDRFPPVRLERLSPTPGISLSTAIIGPPPGGSGFSKPISVRRSAPWGSL